MRSLSARSFSIPKFVLRCGSPLRRISAALSKAVALALSCALLVAPLTACSPQGAPHGDGLKKITFALDYVPNTNHTGIYVAIEKGYYADAGLDVEVVQPPDDGADALVASGRAQLGMSFQDVMANYLGSENPLPVTAVAAVVQHNTSGIMSRQGEGVTSPKGMAGHSYGTWDMDAEKAILASIVESDGGEWGDVRLVPANSTDEVAGLRAGMFDSVWVYEGWALQNARLQDFPVDYFSIGGFDETFDYYTPVIVANDGFLERDPEAAAAFVSATARGYEHAVSNPDEAADILVAYAPETDLELARASQRYLAGLYVDDAPQWGYIDPDRWNRFYAWLSDAGLVSTPIPEGAGFTNDFLPAS